MSDAELVDRILNGDHDAFGALYNRYATRVLTYAVKRTRNQEDAQDIVQETFLKVFQHLPNLRETGKFSTWMFGIAFKLCVDTLRQGQRHPECTSLSRVSDEAIALEAAAIIAERNTVQQATNRWLVERLRKVLAQLRDSERLLLHLKLKGISSKEIAKILGLTEAAVKNRLKRARKNVKILMLKGDSGEVHETRRSMPPENFEERMGNT